MISLLGILVTALKHASFITRIALRWFAFVADHQRSMPIQINASGLKPFITNLRFSAPSFLLAGKDVDPELVRPNCQVVGPSASSG